MNTRMDMEVATKTVVPESIVDHEDDGKVDHDSPPHKKSKKTSVEESGAERTISVGHWNARAETAKESEKSCSHDEDILDIAPFAHYSFVTPFNFRSTGRSLPLDDLGDDEAFFSCVVSGVSEVEPHLYPPNNALAVDTYDVNEYLKKRLEAVIEARKQDEKQAVTNALIEGDLWECWTCSQHSHHDESYCVHCGSQRKAEERLTWTTLFGRALDDEWKCNVCNVCNNNNIAICQACESPRPDLSAVAAAGAITQVVPTEPGVSHMMSAFTGGSNTFTGFTFGQPMAPASSATTTRLPFTFGYNPSAAGDAEVVGASSNPCLGAFDQVSAGTADGKQELAFDITSRNQDVGMSSTQELAFGDASTNNPDKLDSKFGASQTSTQGFSLGTATIGAFQAKNASMDCGTTLHEPESSSKTPVFSQAPLKANDQVEVSSSGALEGRRIVKAKRPVGNF